VLSVIRRRWNQRRSQNTAPNTTTAPLVVDRLQAATTTRTCPQYPASGTTSSLLSPSANNLANTEAPLLTHAANAAVAPATAGEAPSYQRALLCPAGINTFHVSTGDISPFTNDVTGGGSSGADSSNRRRRISPSTTDVTGCGGDGDGSKRHCDVTSAADPLREEHVIDDESRLPDDSSDDVTNLHHF